MTSRAQRQVPTRSNRSVGERDDRDPTVYPVEKKIGEDSLQTWILELLRPLTERWFTSLGRPTLVGSDQFIYYEKHDPSKVVAPDIYVLPGVPPGQRITTWKVWLTGVAPSFALEVASMKDPYKDYIDAPERYRELGVKELIICDPDSDKNPDRVRWQRWRKLKSRGFTRVESTNADRIYSKVLGCFLRMVGEGEKARVRLGIGPEGDELFPTEEEAEHAAKEEALRRVAELEALVAELKKNSA